MTRKEAEDLVDHLIDDVIASERYSSRRSYAEDQRRSRQKVIDALCGGDYEPPDSPGFEGGFASNH